jgi:mono/diheme cytochrome c family protein
LVEIGFDLHHSAKSADRRDLGQEATKRSFPMRKLFASMAVASMLAGINVAGQVTRTDEPRGELLYSTYCVGCHTTQVHWRDKKLATDWTSLKNQVRRWQSNTGLSLGEDDIAAIARYLSRLYYRFPSTDPKQSGEVYGPRQTAAWRRE